MAVSHIIVFFSGFFFLFEEEGWVSCIPSDFQSIESLSNYAAIEVNYLLLSAPTNLDN